jgi:CRISPR-associated protein (TIGR03985 family)
MPDLIWRDPPSLPLLQWLARGSLKQNLAQAVRLWVWLHLLYGSNNIRLSLPNPFTYPDWRDAFFRTEHPKGDEKPELHDRLCPCAKTTDAWLFGDCLTLTQPEWETWLSHPDNRQLPEQRSRQFKQALQQHEALPPRLEQFLHRTRLFAVTRRTLFADLQVLTKIHWLKRRGQNYYLVKEWPVRPAPAIAKEHESYLKAYDLEFLTQPDLAAIADNFALVQGERRFFVHVEYVIPPDKLDQVDHWQEQLRVHWQQLPVKPVWLTYQGAGQTDVVSIVVYPVCVYYYQRGPYLCAFGQVPDGKLGQIDWRNYRLDRILAIAPLEWGDARVPTKLYQQYKQRTLPTSEHIQEKMSDAWGFDYYQEAQLLLLRFDREWDQRYIQGTLRHTTFESVDYQEVGALIRQTLKGQPQKDLLKLWRLRSSEDAYYQAQYRQDDPNVRQRLRAWRPRVEVFLPWDLRQRMTQEVDREWHLYHD